VTDRALFGPPSQSFLVWIAEVDAVIGEAARIAGERDTEAQDDQRLSLGSGAEPA
jgi:hypothetical protein